MVKVNVLYGDGGRVEVWLDSGEPRDGVRLSNRPGRIDAISDAKRALLAALITVDRELIDAVVGERR